MVRLQETMKREGIDNPLRWSLAGERIFYPIGRIDHMATGLTTNADSLRADSARARVDAGDLELPLNAIAKAAGVGVGTVYRHFPTRSALLESLAAQSLQSLVGVAVEAAAGPDAAAGLAGLLRAALRLQLTDPTLPEVLAAREAACIETMDLSRDLVAAIGRLLDRSRAEGVIRPDVTADDIRRLMCGVQHAVRVGAAEDADRYLEILLKGLRP
jgi:AcrR family transcriptional regulator